VAAKAADNGRAGKAGKPAASAASAPSPAKREDRKASSQARAELANRTRPLRQELQQIDMRLGKLAGERGKLEAQMATGTMPGADMAEAGRRLNHIAAEVAMLEERWLELQTEIETLGAQLG